MNAARAGTVTIANAVGNGVGDDKALYPYVPDMIRFYLEEEPVLANVETFRLEEPDVCAWALERLDQLVVKPVDGSGGHGLVIGPHADDQTLTALGRSIRRNPRGGSRRSPSPSRPRRPTSTRRWGPATSTCGRSRSTTASGSGSSPVG